MVINRHRLICASLVTTAAAACREPSSGPAVGTVEVTAPTTGPSADPDGYWATLDGEPARPVSANGTTIYALVAAGEHHLALTGVAANCAVAGDSVRSLTVNEGETAAAEFAIACDPTSGNVIIRIVSKGEDIAPNGYAVLIDDAARLTVAPTGIAEVTVAAGQHLVALARVTPNCVVEGENPRKIAVTTGGDVVVNFNVTCGGAPPAGRGAEIGFVTARLHSDGTDRDIAVVNADGTGLRILADAFGPLAWAPDGVTLAASTPESILVGAIDGEGGFTMLREIERGARTIFGLSWSPDGSELAYTVVEDGVDGCGDIIVTTTDGARSRYVIFDCLSLVELGTLSWSPDGSRLALAQRSDGVDGIWFLDPAVENQPPDGLPTFEGITPAWSPDGARIAFAWSGPGSLDHDLYTARSDGSDRVRLTANVGDDGTPSWSPDGTRIAFVSHRDGNAEIYVTGSDGSNPIRLTNDPATDTLPAWRP